MRPPPVLRTGAITFGCFNNLTKVSDAMISLWAQLLKSFPRSRLLLKTHALLDVEIRGEVSEHFERHGIGDDQLQLAG